MIGRPGKYTIRKKWTPAEDTSGDQLPDPHSVGLELSSVSPVSEISDADTVSLHSASADPAVADIAASDPLAASDTEDLADPPAVFLSPIPIEPTRPIHAPPSWSLPSGD